jgi:hypothetical protein
MKRLFSVPVLISAAMISLLISCKKEAPLNEAIIGRWEVSSYSYDVYQNNVKTQTVTNYMKSTEMVVQFAEGGAGIIYQFGDLAANFTWTLSSNHLTLNMGDQVLSWDITIDNDKLEWTYSEVDTQDATIHYVFFYDAVRTK